MQVSCRYYGELPMDVTGNSNCVITRHALVQVRPSMNDWLGRVTLFRSPPPLPRLQHRVPFLPLQQSERVGMTYSCMRSTSLLRAQRIILPRTFCRYKSITAAIERGRSGGSSRPFKPRSRTNQNDDDYRQASSRRGVNLEPLDSLRDGAGRRFREDLPRSRTSSSPVRGHVSHRPRSSPSSEELTSYSVHSRNSADGHSEPWHSRRPRTQGPLRERHHREQSAMSSGSRGSKDVQQKLVKGPESLPYTTAASEFIYGHSSVLAAIKANRRKFYKLYVHSRGASRDGFMSQIRAHKLFSITQEVGDEYMRAMDKASSGRPHNGIILESSPLPVPPITELKTASIRNESFSVAIGSQSAEDLVVNGNQDVWTYKSDGWRYPLVLYLDGVVSEHCSLLDSSGLILSG